MIRRSDPMESVFSGASLVAVGVACALALSMPAPVMPPKPKSPEVFEVALQAPPPEPVPQPKPETPKPPPPKPVPKPLPVPKPMTPPPPLPQPAPAVEPPPPPKPVVAPVTPPPQVKPQPVTPPPPPPSSANAENTYTSRLRSYIRSITEYPTSGEARRERPEGSVIVRFTLSRQGQLKDAVVEKSSGSSILDKKAIAIVKDGSYPAMPKEIWAADAEHSFTVTVEFVAP